MEGNIGDIVFGAVMVLSFVVPIAVMQSCEDAKLRRELVQRGYAEYVAPEPGLPATEFRLIEPEEIQQKGD